MKKNELNIYELQIILIFSIINSFDKFYGIFSNDDNYIHIMIYFSELLKKK